MVPNETVLKNLHPNFGKLAQLPDCFGVIVTAKGDWVDFVSRFFAPKAGIPEDSVTGSAYSTLSPYWSELLSKETMTSKQLSKRGGMLYVKDCGERVRIAGKAVLCMQGEIYAGM